MVICGYTTNQPLTNTHLTINYHMKKIEFVIATTEKFDMSSFLEKEDITLYQFMRIAGAPVATIYSAKAGKRFIRKEKFDEIMSNYKKNKAKSR